MFKRVISCLCIAVLLLGLCSCSKKSKYGQGFRFPLESEPAQLDPQVAKDDASIEILSAIMEGLYRQNEKGEIVPAIAQSYEKSKDGLVYTFQLRDDVKWEDNTPIVANDFVYAWKRVVDPLTGSSYTSLFENIQGAKQILSGKADTDSLGVEAIDNTTFKVILEQPDEEFVEKISQLPFAPCQQKFFENTNGKYGMEKEFFMATGPFSIVSWIHGEYIILEKNESYYGANTITPSRVRYVMNYEEDYYFLLEDEGLQAAPILDNQVDKAHKKRMNTISFDDQVCSLWFNTQELSLSTRLALRSTLNEESIQETLKQYELSSTNGFVSKASIFNELTYCEQAEPLNILGEKMDLQKCKSEAKSIGTLTVLCSEEESMKALAQDAIQSWQKQLELYFNLETVDSETLKFRLNSGDYTIAIGPQMAKGEHVSDTFAMFTSDNKQNLSNLKDKQYDSLYNSALEKDTLKQWESLEKYLQGICPCVPLCSISRTFAFGEGVDGITIRPFNGGTGKAIYDFRYATRED